MEFCFSSIIRDFTEIEHWFGEKIPSCGLHELLRRTKLHERGSGFLVNGELKITAEVNVLEVIGKLDKREESEETTQPQKKRKKDNAGLLFSDLLNKTHHLMEGIEVNGFVVLPSQVRNIINLRLNQNTRDDYVIYMKT